MLDSVEATSDLIDVDQADRAIGLATSILAFERTAYIEKTIGSLKRWVEKSEANATNSKAVVEDDWKLHPGLSELLMTFGEVPAVRNMSELDYVATDAYYLRQCHWLQKLGQRIDEKQIIPAFELLRLASKKVEQTDASKTASSQEQDELTTLVGMLHPQLDPADHTKLAKAFRLFDWVTRNIHLEEAVYPTPEEIADQSLVEGETTGEPWTLGVIGAGYKRSLYQILLFARGDYIERAKLFIALLAYQDIPAIMLQVDGAPWCVGVKIADEVYLFDTHLGLPIPGKDDGAIATLSMVRADPSLLDRLDLEISESTADNSDYWVKQNQLEKLVGLVYINPECVSKRMRYLEQRLVGDSKLKLTLGLDESLAAFSRIDGLETKIWDIDFKNKEFRQVVEEAINRSRTNDFVRDQLSWYYENEGYIDDFVASRTARAKFVEGFFESERNSRRLNGIEQFYAMMFKDSQIDNLASDIDLQYQIGIVDKSNLAGYNQVIKGVQQSMRMVRRDSGIFLVESLFDNGNIGTAANWLTRISEQENTDRWKGSIDYLQGRTHEARREYDLAMNVYKRDASPQKHGNLLRRRFLAQLTEEIRQESDDQVEDLSSEESKVIESNVEAPAESQGAESNTKEAANEDSAEPKTDESTSDQPKTEQPESTTTSDSESKPEEKPANPESDDGNDQFAPNF